MKSILSLSLLTLPLAAELTVHEWGTFTQVIGSDGSVLDGLEREEEALPLSVTPRPDKLARVIVGRAEILTPAAEKELLLLKKDHLGTPIKLSAHRFALAYRDRIQQLEAKENAKKTVLTNS